jgi:hypothetical protein
MIFGVIWRCDANVDYGMNVVGNADILNVALTTTSSLFSRLRSGQRRSPQTPGVGGVWWGETRKRECWRNTIISVRLER